jgi:hypothetical protein
MSTLATLALLLNSSTVASADSRTITFENPPYVPGSIQGQDGWQGQNPPGIPINPAIDQEIVANSYGYPSFGGQSWRFSNAYTDGAFGDWPFSPSLVNEAGETTAQNLGFSGGIRQNHFEVRFDFASTVKNAEQPGLQMSTAPDRGDGARMSFIRLKDLPAGLSVEFADYEDRPPFGSTLMPTDGCGPEDDFVITTVASGLSRTRPHTVRLTMDFVDGPRNDVVQVFVDGSLRHTGTSWEDFFRWGPGVNGCEGTGQSRTVDSMIFQARSGSGTAPSTRGFGFLIDNLSYFSSQRECRKGDGDGDFDDDKGHRHHAHFHHDSCENNRGDVEDDDRDSGKHFQSTSTDSAAFTSSGDSTTLTMIGTGLDDGLPVGFTMVAVDYGGLVPSIYTLTLTTGRTFTGTLVNGIVQLQ